jgi:hypothetical protein
LARSRIVCTPRRPACRFTGRMGDDHSTWPVHSPVHVEWVEGQGERVRCSVCRFTWIRYAADIPKAKHKKGPVGPALEKGVMRCHIHL